MDRAQPGATGSLVHTVEAGESWGQAADGWVVPSTQPTRSSQAADSGIDETVLNAFDQTHSATSLTVTIDPGEAFVDGWLARDVATDVDLAASTAGQTVFVGWDVSAVYSSADDADRDAADTVIVGLASAFGDLDPTIPLWTFDTDGSGVTSVVDERLLKRHADRPAAHHNPVSVSDPLTEDGAQGLELTLGKGLTISGNALAAAVANGLTLDADGNIRVEADGVTEDMLAFATATETELSNHSGASDVHHSRYSDAEAKEAVKDNINSVKLNNIEFDEAANDEGRIGWDNSEGLRFYWNGSWRQIYSQGPVDRQPLHSRLEDVQPDNHHARYSDSEAQQVPSAYQSGVVASGDAALIAPTEVLDGETLDVDRATLMNSDGTAVATGVDLVIAVLDGAGGYTVQTTVAAGDGGTVYDNASGSYTNSSGGAQTVALLVDNTTTTDYDLAGGGSVVIA
jgi:hypothetical protein